MGLLLSLSLFSQAQDNTETLPDSYYLEDTKPTVTPPPPNPPKVSPPITPPTVTPPPASVKSVDTVKAKEVINTSVKPTLPSLPTTSLPSTAPKNPLSDTSVSSQKVITTTLPDTALKSVPVTVDTNSGKQIPNISVSDSSTKGNVAPSQALSPLPQDGPLKTNLDSLSAVKSSQTPDTTTLTKEKSVIVHTSRINSIDEMKGKYRSPKRALFLSLLVPGLGQAYLGHYIRGGAYFATEVAILLGYRHYVFTKHDRQVTKYQNFADSAWSHKKYEDYIKENKDVLGAEDLKSNFSSRGSFCEAVFKDAGVREACAEFGDKSSGEYTSQAFYTESLYDSVANPKFIGEYRDANYQNVQEFYNLLVEQDMIVGWRDVSEVKSVTTEQGLTYLEGKSEQKSRYLQMRRRANDLANMEKYFLGGLLLNHLVSAIDAAIASKWHNKRLYEQEVRWYDRIRLESYVSLVGGPQPYVLAHLDF